MEHAKLPLEMPETKKDEGPVTCLGMTFENDQERREYFTEILRQKLPELKKIEGYPIGEDEDILALSDPPYYTACPNPFLEDLIKDAENRKQGRRKEQMEPFTGELTSEKIHPVYSFHPYHTKVPPAIIKTLLNHYTAPGDIVLDAFAGTGMTGVAAMELGRFPILSDLSPIASFISAINCSSHDINEILHEITGIIEEVEQELQSLYETTENGTKISVNYFVWSDVFTCPQCTFEFPIFDHGVEHLGNKVKTLKSFECPSCGVELNVRKIERVITYEGKKKALVWVNAGKGRNRINRAANDFDKRLARIVDDLDFETWYPVDPVDTTRYAAKLAQLGDKRITDVSKFLSKRNLLVFSNLWSKMEQIPKNTTRRLGLALLTSIFTIISERQGYFGGGGGMSGNLYMPIVRMEKNIFDVIKRKMKKLVEAEKHKEGQSNHFAISTQSATSLAMIPDCSIDYIYTDPPFGANIMYGEMNLILESWLRVKTNDSLEAVIDVTRGFGFEKYAELMRASFVEYFRVLKPGKWITIEFHNADAGVWNLIQNAIGEGGFIVAQVGVMDKGTSTILTDIRPGAAKYDLVISAYKPSDEFSQMWKLKAGSDAGVWEFVDAHLARLPIINYVDGVLQPIKERYKFMLYDRMVAFHVQRGLMVNISAAEFYELLQNRYAEREGMYFLQNQVHEYDLKRAEIPYGEQMGLYVTDELSAIRWLQQKLTQKPQSYQEVQPEFMREAQAWAKHEKILDLRQILEQNFLMYDGTGPVPSQIHSYLSTNFKDLRGLEKTDSKLQAKAKNRWYVPDPNKQADLEKLRERSLLREFNSYIEELGKSKKKLRQFRTEAIRAGFKNAWANQDYKTIVDVGHRLPERVLQEDSTMLMYYDNAQIRLGM